MSADFLAVAKTAVPPAATVLFRPDAKLLRQLLSTLEGDGCRVFIFVNGSLDEPAEAILSELNNASITRSEENAGLGYGLNSVMNTAMSEGFSHVLLFDQDSTPEAGLAQRLMARAACYDIGRRKCLAVLGPLLVPPSNSSYLPISYWRREANDPDAHSSSIVQVDFVPTSGSLVSIEAWREIGPFRADYFIGGIDVEWGYRAWHKGWVSAIAEDIQMVHRWGEEQVDGQVGRPQILRQSTTRIYYYVRNAVDGMRRAYMPWRWKRQQAIRLLGQICLILLVRVGRDVPLALIFRAVRDGWSGRLGPIPDQLAMRFGTA